MAQSVRERTSELAVLKTLGLLERRGPGSRAGRVALSRVARRVDRPRDRRRPSFARRPHRWAAAGIGPSSTGSRLGCRADARARMSRRCVAGHCRPCGCASPTRCGGCDGGHQTGRRRHDPQPPDHPAAARLVDRGHCRHRGRRGRARRRALDRRRVRGGDAGRRIAQPRDRHAKRRRHRDDERPRRAAETDVIKQAPGLLRDGQTSLASAELFVIIDLPKRSTGTPANVPLRGIETAALRVRDDASIVEGRMLQFGTNEVVVGRAASRSSPGSTSARPFDRVRSPGGSSASSRSDGSRRRDRNLVRCANARRAPTAAGTAISPSSPRLESPETFDAVQGLAHGQSSGRRCPCGARATTTRHSRPRWHPDPDHRLRHRRAHGHRRGFRRHSDDVHRRRDTGAGDRDASRPRDSTPARCSVSVLAESLALAAARRTARRHCSRMSGSTATRRRRSTSRRSVRSHSRSVSHLNSGPRTRLVPRDGSHRRAAARRPRRTTSNLTGVEGVVGSGFSTQSRRSVY